LKVRFSPQLQKELIATIHLPQTGEVLEEVFSFFNDLLSDVYVKTGAGGNLEIWGGVEDR